MVLSEQIVPGSFCFALNYLVDHELDFRALDAQFKNDEVGASACDPRVMLKIVLRAYSQGLISSRAVEQACQRNVQFIAVSAGSQPSHTHIAKFVARLSAQIKPLFRQVLMTCDAQGLIGRNMFAIDSVKMPSNASKERSETKKSCGTALIGWNRLPTRSWPCMRPRISAAQTTPWSPNAKPA